MVNRNMLQIEWIIKPLLHINPLTKLKLRWFEKTNFCYVLSYFMHHLKSLVASHVESKRHINTVRSPFKSWNNKGARNLSEWFIYFYVYMPQISFVSKIVFDIVCSTGISKIMHKRKIYLQCNLDLEWRTL